MRASITEEDSVVTAYRCHGWAHMMGYPVKSILAELYGSRPHARMLTRRAQRRVLHGQGRVHAHVQQAVLWRQWHCGGAGVDSVLVLTRQVPLGAGIALAHQYLGDSSVAIALYGDGAANQGQVTASTRSSRSGVRGVQHCQAVEAARHFCVREQQVWHGHQG